MVVRLFVIEGNLPLGAHCWSIKGENSGHTGRAREGNESCFLQCSHKPFARELHGLLSLSRQFREIWCAPLVFDSQAGKALIHIKLKIKKKLEKLTK